MVIFRIDGIKVREDVLSVCHGSNLLRIDGMLTPIFP
jgi:hypothetical protein